MKKLMLVAAAAAMTLVGTAASAQGYGGYRGGYEGRYDGGHRGWDRGRHDGDRYDRRSYDRRGASRWRQGQVYPYYRQGGYAIQDYRAYRLPPPRAGYRYYRSDNGDVVMAAIASGIIGMIIGGALSDNNDRYDGRYDNSYDRGYGGDYYRPY